MSAVRRWLDRYTARSRTTLPEAVDRALTRSRTSEGQSWYGDDGPVMRALEALDRLSPDPATVSALVLLPDYQESGGAPDPDLPEDIRALLQQLARLSYFGRAYLPDDQSRAEGLRQLLLALIADVRVVLVALAWQVARLRCARGDDDTARGEIARETQLIHAPLANRLGIWQLKWELEDFAFRYLEPETYHRISRLVAERRGDRESFIERFIERLREVVGRAGIRARVSGRPKHIYSIWRKMQRKGLDFHELFDVRAVRVTVDSVEQCYSVLGLVHTHWQPVPGEFDDYITNPKANGYQSLHTAVTGAGERVVEVQIRTRDMHRHAELGVAAHWRYKEGGPRDAAMESRIGVMRQLLEGDAGERADAELLEDFGTLTSEDRVYVLTPKGEVRDLAAGATPLDFAYLIHTEVGHRCRGARVNGRLVPLTTELQNGDRVEILTGREPQPSRDWLVPRLGYLRTARARGKVRQWFRQAHYDDNLQAGRQAVEAELRRLDLDPDELPQVAGEFNLQRVDDLLAAVGSGEITALQVARAIERRHQRPADDEALLTRSRPAGEVRAEDDIRIEGIGNLMHQIARCCQPVPGDTIGGYVTRGRGVSIHRQDCRQFLNLQRQQPDRILDVGWSRHARGRYRARVRVEAFDRRELIRDIGTVMAGENAHVAAMNTSHGDHDEQVEIELDVMVGDFDQLATVLNRLQAVPNVTSARRLR